MYILAIGTGLLGLVMGSFAGATVWRLRAKQLDADTNDLNELQKHKKAGVKLSSGQTEDLDYLRATKAQRTAELMRIGRLTKASMKEDRSQCLSCGHTLAWYDLVPLASWLSTGGKCRYCKQPIGAFEPLMELGTAAVFTVFTIKFAGMYNLLSGAYVLLALWLAAFTMLIILLAYDLKWFLLPDKVTYPLIVLSVVITGAGAIVAKGGDIAGVALSVLFSVLILGGLYFVLWAVSKGRWVGFGDVKLGVALGILLVDWKLAFLTLFLANLIGTLVVLPGLIMKKVSRTTQVPFGPFLIIGFFISLLWGSDIIIGYESFSTWLSTTLLML